MNKKIIPWLISGISLALSIIGWGQNLGWQLSDLSLYVWFPLFGLIAFSLMWAHYAVDFIGRFLNFQVEEGPYLQTTRYVVFFSLLMHPGLLAWQRWHEGFGLPPLSWLNFVEPDLRIGMILGLTAWLAFLGFELHYWFRSKSWFNWIIIANALSMILVVIHVIYLAQPIGWLRYLWYLYGITLIIFFAKELYNHIFGTKNKRQFV